MAEEELPVDGLILVVVEASDKSNSWKRHAKTTSDAKPERVHVCRLRLTYDRCILAVVWQITNRLLLMNTDCANLIDEAGNQVVAHF